jgi:hypothetical protein
VARHAVCASDDSGDDHALKAAAFIRYHSGEGFGHVGWAFDFDNARVNAGSVENHSGHIFSPSRDMGFWTAFSSDPTDAMRAQKYDDVKYIDVPNPNPILAYRTVLWIETMEYRAFLRNCEDDVYDVLRAYGIDDLTPPSIVWFPKSWFKRFRGTLAHVSDFTWRDGACHREVEHCHREVSNDPEESRGIEPPQDITPWHPTWRRPWHPDFHKLNIGKLFRRSAN